MTRFFLAEKDSLRLLRFARSSPSLFLSPCPEGELVVEPYTSAELLELRRALPPEMSGFDAASPLCLTFFSRESRSQSKLIRPFVSLSALPPGAFLEVMGPWGRAGSRVYVESPALALVRMAQVLLPAVRGGQLRRSAALVRLMGLAMEFCGTYARDPLDPLGGPCAYGVEPLADADSLRRFLLGASGIRGLRFAREASGYALDGSASPAETLLALAMSLPPRLGGAPLPGFAMNEPLELEGDATSLLHHRSMRPDFYWREQRVALEYNGKVHDSEDGHEEDHFRRQDYATCGIGVVEARSSDVRDTGALERLIKLVALELERRGGDGPSLRKRIDASLQDPQARVARAQLVYELTRGRRHGEPG